MPELRVVALLQGEPDACSLWTLSRLACTPSRLAVVEAPRPPISPRRSRLERLIAARVLARGREQLDQLFEGERLRNWWRSSEIERIRCTYLDHADAQAALVALRPDLGVRVSGKLWQCEILSIPRLATLDVHHGRAPAIRGQFSIPWGIVENRPDWIGATVYKIDDGINVGRVLWRGGAQIAPGDTGEHLFFRSHLEATEALVEVIRVYAAGGVPASMPSETSESPHRGAPGAHTWLRYLWLGRGKYAPVTLESAVRC